MKIFRRKKLLVQILLISGTSIFIYWDFSNSLNATVQTGTYRLESGFTAPVASSVNVSIVPSDYSGLNNPVARTINPSYSQVEDMVREAVELQGGLSGIVSPGDTVMLKVNLVGTNSPSGQGENTDVRVVKALIKILDDFTSGNVVVLVAEGSARSNDNPLVAGSVWHNSGYVDLLTDSYLTGIDFQLLNLNQGINDLVEVNLGSEGTAAPHNYIYKVHKKVLSADVYISVPVLKIHDTGITSALKNQIGIAPGCYYGYNKMSGTGYHPGLYHDVEQRRWTTEEIVDLSNIADIDFIVVDAIMCLEKYKTYDGTNQVRFNTIIAGADPVAVDNICTRLFCMNPDDIAHITLAEKVGLGTNNRSKIKVVGESIDNVKKSVEKNTSGNGRFGQSNRTWLLSETFSGTNIATQHIANESTYNPIEGQSGWSYPVYFFDDRIDLLSYYNNPTSVTIYAFSDFYAPKTQSAELWIGYDEAIRVYVNGVNVFENTSIVSYGYADLEKTIQNITINEGINTIMVKTVQSLGDFSFVLNICEPDNSGNRVDSLVFKINSVIDFPPDSINLTSSAIKENLPVNALFSRISVSDKNSEDEYSYSLVTGAGDINNSWFKISGDSILCNHLINYEEINSLSIRVKAEDNDNNAHSISQEIIIPVHDVNEAPVSFEINHTELDENQPENTLIGSLTTTDVDLNDLQTYKLVSGTGSQDNGSFSIIGNSLYSGEIFNFETKHNFFIRVRTTDKGGLYIEDTLTIKLNNVDEAPKLTELSHNIIENGQPAGTYIGIFTTVDEDGGLVTQSFAAGSGSTDNDRFILKNDSLFSDFISNYSEKSGYSIRIRSTDNTGLYLDNVFIIEILEPSSIDIDWFEKNSPCQIFPSPFSHSLYLKSIDNKIINSVRITNINGKILYSNNGLNTKEVTLSTSGFEPGIYILVVEMEGINYQSVIIKQEDNQ